MFLKNKCVCAIMTTMVCHKIHLQSYKEIRINEKIKHICEISLGSNSDHVFFLPLGEITNIYLNYPQGVTVCK